MNQVGRVKALRRYPVKSMRGEDLERVFVCYSGLLGDRVYAFVDPAKKARDFPWLTAREVPEMILFSPHFLERLPAEKRYPRQKEYRVEVLTPDGIRYDVEDAAFAKHLTARWNRPCELRFSEQGMHDSRPLSIFGAATLKCLGEETGVHLDYRRFRPNFLIDWAEDEPFVEEKFLGRTLQIGETLNILIAKKDSRCVIINLEPETSASNPEVLKKIVKKHGGCAGVYGVTIQEGPAAVGDPVYAVET